MDVNWDADFDGLPPIDLPDGRKLETLADCRAYILALPPRQHKRWEPVVAELLKRRSMAARSDLPRG